MNRGTGWRRAGVLVAVSIVLMVGACAGLDVWAGRGVENELARLEARYGSFDESTLVVPAVPDADNRARIVRAAAALAVEAPGQRYHFIPLDQLSPVPAELRALADANRDAIRVARDIRTRRQSNWETADRKSRQPWERVRILVDAIYVTALMDVEAGRADEAATTIVSGLGVTASFRQEPEMGAQMMRVIWANRQLEAIRQLVTHADPSKAALDELAWWLAENRTPDPVQIGALGDVKRANAMFARMENGDIDRNTATYIYPETWPSWPSAYLGPVARIGRPFVREARLRYLRQMGHLLDLLAGPRPRPASAEPPAPLRWALIDRLTDKFAARPGLGDLGDDFASELGATEVAVALRRFKLDHGAYPDDLSALAPVYLARLPIDPYTGRPPVYAREGAGFTLRAKDSNSNAAAWRALEWNVPR